MDVQPLRPPWAKPAGTEPPPGFKVIDNPGGLLFPAPTPTDAPAGPPGDGT